MSRTVGSLSKRDLETKIRRKLNICHHILTSAKTTAKQVISRRGKIENVCQMSKSEKCTCKVCKSIVFHCRICKFVLRYYFSVDKKRLRGEVYCKLHEFI